MPSGNHRTADWKQVETIDSEESANASMAIRMRPWRFNELQKSLNGISQKVLTQSLRSMEADGLIIRTVYAEVPPRVEYSLSELVETMRPILDAMEKWGNAYKATHLKSLDC